MDKFAKDNYDNDGQGRARKEGRDVKTFASNYLQMKQFWTDALELKEPLPSGNSTTIARYLRKYAKEDDVEFAERVKRLAQVNFVDLIIDTYNSMLFSTNVQIKSVNFQDEVNKFVQSCNSQGDTLLSYFAEVIAPSVFTYGVCDVFVDLPSTADPVASAQQQKDAGLNTPYCYVIPPLNRVFWALDEQGKYSEYQSWDVIDTEIDLSWQVKDDTQFSIWTADTVTRYNGKNEVVEQVTNPFGFIPAVTVVSRYSMRYQKDKMGLSLIQDIVPLQKLVINLISLILDYHENANFATRVLIQDTDNGDEAPTSGEMAELGNKRGIKLQGKGSRLVTDIPPSEGVESMRQFLAEVIDRIYQSVSITSDSNVNKTHQTQGSIRSNQAVLFNKLSKITKHFERAMKSIIEMALKVQGINPVDAGVTVQWDTNFSYESFINSLENLALMKSTVADISPTAVSEYTKSVVSPQLYNSPKLDQIEQEINDWKPAVVAPTKSGIQQPGGPNAAANIEQINQNVNAVEKIAQTEV
jgi:hypothetical protein